MERYEAYKDSGVKWLGEIPKKWFVSRNKNAFTYRKSVVGEAWARTQLLSLTTQGVRLKDLENPEGKLPESFEGYQFVKPNDIVMCLFDLDLSAVFSGLSAYSGMISPAYRVITPTSVDSRYAAYWFNYVFQGRKFVQYSKSLRSTITFDEFGSLPLLLPSLNEQRAIADYLDVKTAEIDALVADCEREVELLQEYRKAVITEAVTKGLDPDVPMKDSGVEWIGEIPEAWSIAKVKSCCDILPGYAFKSELFIQESGSVKLLRGINLGVNVIRWDKVVSYPLDEIEALGTYRLLAGDVVIGLDRPWIKEGLRIAIIQDEIFEQYLVQRVARLRGSFEVDVRFVKYALESGLLEYELDSLTTGVSVPHISTEQIGSTRITLPDIATQHEIIALLDNKTAEIDSLINAKQSMADRLREYRRSLISEAVTGKFKVPGV